MWVFIYGVGFPVSFGFFTACCCVYGVTEWDPILFFGFLWMQMKICIVLYVLFWYSIYLFLLHSTCSMKSLLDLISDDWIQFFPPTYCDKSKWFIHLWTMNMNKKNSRMKSRRYQHGEKNELWTKCEAIDSIT